MNLKLPIIQKGEDVSDFTDPVSRLSSLSERMVSRLDWLSYGDTPEQSDERYEKMQSALRRLHTAPVSDLKRPTWIKVTERETGALLALLATLCRSSDDRKHLHYEDH